jgi:glucuronoarabinoxylan endo-1,4-beta-xylanase
MRHLQQRSRGWYVAGLICFQGLVFLSQIQAQFPDKATVYLDSMKQVIRGFGGANIVGWRPDMTPEQIDKAFGTAEDQVGLTLLRLRIPPDVAGFNVNVPSAKQAYALGANIIASPWTPPAWMKTSNSVVDGRLIDYNYQDYAEHLSYFVDFMESNDVPIYAISIQNEPDAHVDYESCSWNASEMRQFLIEEGPYIGTRLIVPESQGFNKALSDPILNDPEAAENVAIIGGHLYAGGLEPYPLAESKGKEVWMTEHSQEETTWVAALYTGKEIHDCMNYGMSAYVFWYLVRFYGPIGEDGEVTKRGYVMSHYAKFVRPGYVRVEATDYPQRQVYVTAYRGDSRLIIVILNTAREAKEQTFQIQDISTNVALTPYVTSETKNCEEENQIWVQNGQFTVTLDVSSVTTLVANGISGVSDVSIRPQLFRLHQNFPNPFNPVTRIRYNLNQSGHVILRIYSTTGRQLETLVNGFQTAGEYEINWWPGWLASGRYLYRLQSGEFSETKQLILLK